MNNLRFNFPGRNYVTISIIHTCMSLCPKMRFKKEEVQDKGDIHRRKLFKELHNHITIFKLFL